jgi:secretion/DNA translocation related TadE-like protein
LNPDSVSDRGLWAIRRKFQPETGAAGILAIGTISVILGLVMAVLASAGEQQTQAKVAFAADQAALAAVDTLNGRFTGFPCEVARKVAEENMAKLDECRIVGFEVYVSAKLTRLGMVHFATARAAPPSNMNSREQ